MGGDVTIAAAAEETITVFVQECQEAKQNLVSSREDAIEEDAIAIE